MSEQRGLLERLMGAGKKKAEQNQGLLETRLKEQLKGLVYDDELVNELLPVFVKLQGIEGFDKVTELLITKEKQIEAIAGGDWFKQESSQSTTVEKDEDEPNQSAKTVDELLKEKYSPKGN